MIREHVKALLPIIQAFAEGKTIQVKQYGDVWVDAHSPDFSAAVDCYRIKPEPREFYLHFLKDGRVAVESSRSDIKHCESECAEVIRVREVLP